MFKIAIICLLVTASAFGDQSRQEQRISEPQQMDLFVSGQDGYNTYRIPSVIVTQAGTVLAFCEGRKFRVHDASPTDMVLKRSFDNGRTWTPMQVVVEGVPDAIMDPCPVIDHTTGTIWLVYDRYPKDFKHAAGFGMDSGTAWVTHSSDEGATWSAPVNITATTKRKEWTIIAHGPGVGIQMRSGRLIIPCYSSVGEDPKTNYSFAIYSDDHGKSWHLGEETGPMTNESQVVELADGSLMLNMRTCRNTGYRAMAISKDNGVTWSEPVDVPELIEPACQASFIRYSWPGKDSSSRILFCNPACKNDRIKLTVRLSYDEARTWPVSKLLYAGPSAYCCLAVLKDGDIACFYEGGDKYQHEKIIFARFSLEWLTDGRDKKDLAKTCPDNNIEFNYPALNAQAIQESLEPIRPGVPGKQPFWNVNARRFIYAPAFNFKPVDGAVSYRFTATSKTDNKEYVFGANEPWAALTPIWRELPVGPVVLTVEGLDNQGREFEQICQVRKFYRAAVFKGPYHQPVMDYKESALQALEYLFNEKYIKRWAEDGQPDTSYDLYCYPSKIIGAVIRAMSMYSELSPADAKEALQIAQRAAEYLISISEPAGAPLEYFPPTYSRKGYESRPSWNQAAERHKDKLMMSYPAEAATAYLDLYNTTKDIKFFAAAKRIADTYVKLQLPCGTWPAMVDYKTGKATAENLCMPTMWIIPFLERLEEQYGMDEYRTAKEKAFRWVMENPMKTFNWEGQFEDQLLSGDYENLTAIDACYHAVYLLKHSKDNPQYIKQAEELLRFAEDQFVVWESIMPKEYRRRKTLGYANYLLPCALEQYSYMDAIGAVAAIMIRAYQKAYQITGIELYLAKACTLANSMTVAQQRNSKFAPGRYPTIWRKQYESKDVIWVNCLTIDAEAMLSLAKLLQQRK